MWHGILILTYIVKSMKLCNYKNLPFIPSLQGWTCLTTGCRRCRPRWVRSLSWRGWTSATTRSSRCQSASSRRQSSQRSTPGRTSSQVGPLHRFQLGLEKLVLLWSAYFFLRGCLRLVLVARPRDRFTHPLRDKFALLSTKFYKLIFTLLEDFQLVLKFF